MAENKDLFEDSETTAVDQPTSVWVESDLYIGSRKKSHEKELNVNYVRKSKPSFAIFGGNASCLIKGVPYSSDCNSCVRRIMLRNDKVEQPLDFRACCTFAIGNVIETELGDDLTHKGHNVVRGDRVHVRLLGEEVTEDGMPFEFFDEADLLVDGIPYEVKSVSSVTMWEKVFINNTPKFDNIIQTAHHMLARKIPQGKLVYVATLYHSKDKTVNKVKTKHKVAAGDIKEFTCEFRKDGNLYVDGESYYGINVKGLAAWRDWAVLAVYNKDWTDAVPSYYGDLDDGGGGFKRDNINPVCGWCDYKRECSQALNYLHFKQLVLQSLLANKERGEDDERSEI